MAKTNLKAVPLSREQVNEFVDRLHRHHKHSVADKFRLGCEMGGVLVGVLQVGRPVNRTLDDGATLEVTRLCTNGTVNVCSFLYARAAKVAQLLGYSKIVTYILCTETGVSLKAAGWHKEADTKYKPWNTAKRERDTATPTCDKQRWSKELI